MRTVRTGTYRTTGEAHTRSCFPNTALCSRWPSSISSMIGPFQHHESTAQVTALNSLGSCVLCPCKQERRIQRFRVDCIFPDIFSQGEVILVGQSYETIDFTRYICSMPQQMIDERSAQSVSAQLPETTVYQLRPNGPATNLIDSQP